MILLMNSNVTAAASVAELAQAVNLSPSRLRHVFKAETGTTPARYHKMLKMQRVKDLLETTFLNVKQINSQFEFSDESHFLRDFKKTYGLTPSQYRKLNCATTYSNNNSVDPDHAIGQW